MRLAPDPLGGPEERVNTHPYDALQPDRVLDAVECLGVVCDGRLFALNSFENRVYQVGREGAEPVIAKFYRPDRLSDAAILEEHAFLQELAEADLPVAAPIADADGRTLIEVSLTPADSAEPVRYRVALFPKLRGRAPELESEAHLEWLGRLIGRIHQVGARTPFRARPALSVATLGEHGLQATLAGTLMPPSLKPRFEASVRALLDAVRAQFAATPTRSLRLHGDLHPGNLLWNDTGPVFVDFDDCCMGPAIQDLWMLLPGDAEGQQQALAALCAGYEVFRTLDPAELAWIEPLRALRMIHYGGWLSARYDDPAFPRAFPHAASARFWDEHLQTLEAQAERIALGNLWPNLSA